MGNKIVKYSQLHKICEKVMQYIVYVFNIIKKLYF